MIDIKNNVWTDNVVGRIRWYLKKMVKLKLLVDQFN